MKPELSERLARLGRTKGIDPVSSGSPAAVVLRPDGDLSKVKTIFAMRALVRRHLALRIAKRAIEDMVDNGEAVVHVPMVESMAALDAELLAAGVKAKTLATRDVDVKELRARLGLTQEQFAMRFGLDVDAVQNWEQGRCQPDKPARAYLRTIAADPQVAARAQEAEMV